ncbi:sensor histidine kinase [Bombilactobacillus bombi]|uniref:sensor histidine kinase n=1 Tax=Bombilactobacillus bombi TaxID=1303590 RepID=UPI0015E5E016|nr:GHKL domain-containing protein [Bombilactobacillus bombi]MBA1434695.1 GHKL domain-containing protein [Bombilactobacillus bombi]
MNIISTQADLVENIVIVFLVILITAILNNKYKKKYLFSYLIILIINSLIGLLIENLNLFIWFIATLIFQKLQMKRLDYKFLNNRLIAMIIILIVGIVANCIETFLGFFTNMFFNIEYSNDISAYICVLLYFIILAILAIYAHKHDSVIYEISHTIQNLNLENGIFKILFFLFSSILAILIISQQINITNIIKLPLLIIFIVFVSLTFIQVFSFIQSYSYRQQAEAKIAQNQQLQEYLQNMEQQYQELRHFKHDYQNMLLALEGFAKNDNQQEFKDYYQQLVQQQPHTENLDSLTIAHIDYLKNEPLRGLIVQKFFTAKQKQIKLQLEITQNIKIKNPDILSIIRILGILLDNAIEQTTKETEKVVQCAFNYIDNKVIEITIANPATNLTNIDQLFTNGYTTKKGHQGFGLTNVQKLVKQNKNLFLETELLDQHLTITIMITGEE